MASLRTNFNRLYRLHTQIQPCMVINPDSVQNHRELTEATTLQAQTLQ